MSQNSNSEFFGLGANTQVDYIKVTWLSGTIDFIEKIYPSEANFFLIKVKDANLLYKHLLKKGIVVRDRSWELNCENSIRISIGTREENDLLLKYLKEL